MARKSRKNMPVAVAEPTDNLTAKAVSMDKEAKTYQVGIYAETFILNQRQIRKEIL